MIEPKRFYRDYTPARPRFVADPEEQIAEDINRRRAAAALVQPRDPEERARALQLQSATGLPANAVEGSTKDFMDLYWSKQHTETLASNPWMASYIGRNPDAAKVISNKDVENVAGIGVLFRDINSPVVAPKPRLMDQAQPAARRNFKELAARARQQRPESPVNWRLGRGLRGAAGVYGEAAGRTAKGVVGLAQMVATGVGADNAAAAYAQSGQEIDQWMSNVRPDLLPGLQTDVYGGLVSASQTAALLPLNSVRLISGAFGGLVAGEEFARFTERGASGGSAALGAIASGATEVVTERYLGGLGWLLGKRGAGSFLRDYLGAEMVGEQIATAAQDAIDIMVPNSGKTWSDYIKERPGAAWSTAVSTLTMIGVMGGVGGITRRLAPIAERQQEAQRGLAGQVFLDSLMETAERTETRKTAPTEYAKMVADAADGTAVREVYIPVEAISTYMQSGSATPEEQAFFTAYQDQIQDAARSNGDVAIPVGELAANLAGTGAWKALREDARVTPGGISGREAREQLDTQIAELERIGNEVLAEATGQAPNFEAKAKVYQEVKAGVLAAGRSEREARTTAALYAARAENLASARYGTFKSIEEAWNWQKIQFQKGGQQAGAAMQQAEGVLYHGTPFDFDTFADNGKAVWLAEDPRLAARYANARRVRRSAGDRILPARANFRNPLRVDETIEADNTIEDPVAWAKENFGFDLKAYGWERSGSEAAHDITRSLAFANAARAAGFDAIGIRESGGMTWGILSRGAITSSITGDTLFQSPFAGGFEGIAPYLTDEEQANLRDASKAKILSIVESLPDAEEMAAVALAGRAKRGWYENSALAILDVFGAADAPRFAALLAALSPQTSVEMNLYNALKVWTEWNNSGRPTERRAIVEVMGRSVAGDKGVGSILNAWLNNSVTALTAKDPGQIKLSGPKVDSFMNNLVGVVDEVTNDAWMANYANVDQVLFKKTGQNKGPGYKAMNAVVRKAADILTERTGETWSPAEVQETVWSFAKTLYEKRDAAGEDRDTRTLLMAGGVTHDDIANTPDFAVLFSDGIFQTILEEGGYGDATRSLGGSRRAVGVDGSQSIAAFPEGAGFDEADFRRFLIQAADRLETVRARRRGSGRTAGGSLAPLEGAPNVRGLNGPIPGVVRAAEAYAQSIGQTLQRQPRYVEVDPERAARIADAYEAMPHAPQDPAVAAAYADMIRQTRAQYDALVDAGYEFYFLDPDSEYAASPFNALRELASANRMGVFATVEGFGSSELDVSDNPLLADTGLTWTDVKTGEQKPVLANDLFRAVHDAFGHGIEGAGFRAQGEENAWQAHVRLFTGPAVRAMTTETRGQNSWLNYGPHGEKNRTAKVEETIFADQKTGLLPEWASTEGIEESETFVAEDENGFPLEDGLVSSQGDGNLDPTTFRQGPRGQVTFGADGTTLIQLFGRADFSTLVHETSHVWLQQEFQLAQMPGASEELKADVAKLRAWMEKNGGSFLENGMPDRNSHELFARTGERYFREGIAPSAELRGAFKQYREWLKSVYRNIRDLLAFGPAPINPEIREIMDRMIATSEAIEDNAKGPMSREELGMEEDEYERYEAAVQRTQDEAHDTLLGRMMRAIKQREQVKYRIQRENVRKEVRDEVNSDPAFIALHLLRTGRWLNDPAREPFPVKLNTGWLIDNYGEDVLKQLPVGLQPLHRGDGLEGDFIAEMVGMPSGDALVTALREMKVQADLLKADGNPRPLRDHIVETEVDRIMAERHGDVALSDDQIREEAIAALNSERQGELLAEELRQLQKKSRRPGAITPYQLLREWARRKSNEGTVGDALSKQTLQRYIRNYNKATKDLEAALVKNDEAEVLRQKQAQMVNHALLAEAKTAADQIGSMVRKLQRLARTKALASIDQDYMDRIHELLEGYNFRPTSQRFRDERASFEEWAKAQREQGHEVYVPERFRDERVPFEEARVEKLIELFDMVSSLEAQGKLKQKLTTARDNRERKAIIDDARQRILSLPERKLPDTSMGKDESALRKGASELIKVENLVDILDGTGDGTGPLNRVLVQPATDAANKYSQLWEEVMAPVIERMRGMTRKQRRRLQDHVTISELTFNVAIDPNDPRVGEPVTITRMQLLGMLANTGNLSNLTKMVGGERWGNHESAADIERVRQILISYATKEDLDLVQDMWDGVDKLWPYIAEVERELTGIVPERVVPMPFEAYGVEYRGGYWPVVWDSARSDMGRKLAEEETGLLEGVGFGIGTPKGHTITRTEAIAPMEYRLDLVLNGHLNKVVSRIAYAPWVRDALKIINNPAVRGAIDLRMGKEYTSKLKPWIRDQIPSNRADYASAKWWAGWVDQARINMSIAVLGVSYTTGVAQLLGLGYSAGVLGGGSIKDGGKWMAAGIYEALRLNAKKGMSAQQFVFERSPEMTRRASEVNREAVDVINKLKDNDTIVNRLQAMAFWHIGFIDLNMVAIPTWLGAYQKGLAQGMEEADAVAFAEKAVRKSQGSGRAKDLSAIQRGGPAEKFVTLFYTPSSVFFNQQWEAVQQIKAGNWSKAVAPTFWFLVMTSIANAMREGDWPEDDDEDGMDAMDIGSWAARNIGFELFYGIPGARDIANSSERMLRGEYTEFGTTPISAVLAATGKGIKAGVKWWEDEEDLEGRELKNLANAAGFLFGLPSNQPGKTAGFLYDVSQGNVEPEDAGDWYAGLTSGKIPEETE